MGSRPAESAGGRSFRLALLLRAALLVGALAAVAVAWAAPGYHAVTLLFVLVSAVSTAELVSFVGRTNRELRRFLDSACNEDFASRPDGRPFDAGFAELHRSFEEVNRRFRALRSEREEEVRQLRALVEHVPVPLLCVHPDGKVEVQNIAARRLFAARPPVRVEDLEAFGDALAGAVASIRPGERRLVTMRVEGEEHRVTVAATEVVARGRSERLLSVQDIRSELEREQIESWQGLVRVLTHEIMNSITPVASLARTAEGLLDDVLASDGAPAALKEEMGDLRQAVETVARRSDALMKFVSSYRKLTRLPAPSPRPVAVRPLLESAVRLARADAGDAAPDFVVEVRPEGLEIEADEGMLEQVLINLLRNATQALEGRGGTVWLSGRISPRGRGVLEVADDGPGIPPEIADKVFYPYFTTRRDGSGVGLALTRQVMIAHGGTVALGERPGGGARFVLTF